MKKIKRINQLFKQDIFNIIAGPCAIETEDSLYKTAEFLHNNKINFIRGGAFKLRTSPDSFQGLGKIGIHLLHDIAAHFDLITVSEITSISEIEIMDNFIDVILVGTRNMFNYPLLKELSKLNKPIILKRGMSATVNEWLLAAKYVSNIETNIILCERGIRTFETCTRNTLDLSSAVWVQQNSKYNVIIDPSHATGDSNLIIPMSLAALASGCNGLMIEIHPSPEKSLSDGQQMLNFSQFAILLDKLYKFKSFSID